MLEREPYVDSKPVAEFLGVTPAFVDRLALLNEIPALPLPSANGTGARTRWRFRMSEVEAWAKARAKGPRK